MFKDRKSQAGIGKKDDRYYYKAGKSRKRGETFLKCWKDSSKECGEETPYRKRVRKGYKTGQEGGKYRLQRPVREAG